MGKRNKKYKFYHYTFIKTSKFLRLSSLLLNVSSRKKVIVICHTVKQSLIIKKDIGGGGILSRFDHQKYLRLSVSLKNDSETFFEQ